MRVCVPQAAVAGIDHDGKRYFARNGVMTVPDHVGRDLIKYDECFPAADSPAKASGFVCVSCGFHGYFRTCGRCGSLCERPNHESEQSNATSQEDH